VRTVERAGTVSWWAEAGHEVVPADERLPAEAGRHAKPARGVRRQGSYLRPSKTAGGARLRNRRHDASIESEASADGGPAGRVSGLRADAGGSGFLEGKVAEPGVPTVDPDPGHVM